MPHPPKQLVVFLAGGFMEHGPKNRHEIVHLLSRPNLVAGFQGFQLGGRIWPRELAERRDSSGRSIQWFTGAILSLSHQTCMSVFSFSVGNPIHVQPLVISKLPHWYSQALSYLFIFILSLFFCFRWNLDSVSD
jgi:hypothetical protein